MHIKNIAFYTLLIAISFGCTSISNTDDFAYIGGEIISPKNKTVILYNTKGKVSDTLTLDANNRFIHKITDLKSGLYSIRHGGEYQMVVLEPNDSIMLRVNTYDFDASLVFTGKGSKKNNYLIKTYMFNENEGKKLVEYAQMEPEAFNAFVEKRCANQLDELNTFLEHNKQTAFFKSIIETTINYSMYADKEIYPFAYFGNNKLIHFKDLPENFYAYRKNIDYNANHLSNFFSYNRFLFSHFDNLALTDFYKHNEYHAAFNRHSVIYNRAKLNLIDSLITDPTIKNNLLKYKVRDFVSQNRNVFETKNMLDFYFTKSTNDKDKAYIKGLVKSINMLKKGNILPTIKVINYNNSEHTLNQIITKPTVLYFWSSNIKAHYKNSRFKIKELKLKFPGIDFISVLIKDNEVAAWKAIINYYGFANHNEYRFKNSKTALKTLAVNYVNKAIIVDKTARILNANANIYGANFEANLKTLTLGSF